MSSRPFISAVTTAHYFSMGPHPRAPVFWQFATFIPQSTYRKALRPNRTCLDMPLSGRAVRGTPRSAVPQCMTHTDLVRLARAKVCSFVLARSNPVSLDLPAYRWISVDIEHSKNRLCFSIKSQFIFVKDVHDPARRMQACELIMFHYACTYVGSGVLSGSAAKGVLRKRAQIGGTRP